MNLHSNLIAKALSMMQPADESTGSNIRNHAPSPRNRVFLQPR